MLSSTHPLLSQHCVPQHRKIHGQGSDLAGVVPESSPVTKWVIASNAGIQHCKVSFSADASPVPFPCIF